ncbi:lipase family alpha/beta hydrolase [Massilia pseudoviolaceinigra]|uniref:lipase family alpha/beta hydrolase n=1 Tax=Massilia pseudoviolaceinigra TaxID=3057165 RepID=UPI002796471B|nr:alpha/beta hydrolase [Massilia sp. CCM 9206]MDQ1922697.1 alpha/beta hydrolase [Massilia sp. CCM 9206]
MLALLCFCLSACSLVKLKEETKTFYSSTVLAGHVSSADAWDKPVVVAAYTRRNGRLEIAHYTVLHEAGGYELIVQKGDYALFAFGDANGNLTLDAGEPVGEYGAAPVRATGTGSLVSLDVVISATAQSAVPRGTSVAARASAKTHSTQAGAIARLDDPLMSAESGRRGYWAPVDFFKEVGGNIYFLEEYDARKTPVLFVHGAAGSPQDWSYFLKHLDRSRYQPWIFYYPSGSSLDSMSYLLYWKLSNLQRRHHFDRLYLTAHSMGGLVVRSFLADYGDQFPAAKLFVTLSTPWGGDALADQGVAYSPAVIPSWNDVRAGGRYVQTLFRKPLPRELDYYLMFGHGGRYSLLRPASNDGTITLSSQLRSDAQSEARRVFGYDEDHVGILSSPQVFAQYAALLKAADQRDGDGRSAGKGNLRVAFSYARPDETPASAPVLVLTPVDATRDATRERIVLPVSTRDSGRELGPFPPGVYNVGLMARAFKTTPASTQVTIGTGGIPALRFELTPQGVLSGYIGADVTPADNPAGSFRAGRRDIQIESIVLTNGTDRREIAPSPDTRDRTLEAYVAGQDYLFKSFFSFVGLKEGRYELTINATGYPPYRRTYDVVPGKYGYLTPIDLTAPKQEAP